jgi:1-acyl-sn-glycerol-3-phosphate acyltransferase
VKATVTKLKKRLPVNGRVALRMARPTASQFVRRLPFPLSPPTVPAGVEPPKTESKVGANYDTDWARSYPARAARVLLVEGVVRPALGALAAPRVHGLDRLEAIDGPVVFAANHHSHVDAPLLITSVPEPWRHRLVVGAAADYFFATRFTGALSALAMGAIPIDRTRVNRRSGDLAAELLEDDWSILIFPEGGRSPDGWGQPFRGGAAYLSVRTGAPVVPIHLEGTGRIMGRGMNRPRPGRTLVTFGAPLFPQPGDDARSLGARIEHAVYRLADEAATDWWSARQRAARGETPVLTGPEGPSWRRAWALGDRKGRRRKPSRSWPNLD